MLMHTYQAERSVFAKIYDNWSDEKYYNAALQKKFKTVSYC